MEIDPRSHSYLGKLGSKVGGGFRHLSTKSCSLFGNIKIHVAAATVQILYAGFQVLASAALSDGVNRYVFPVYRNIIATIMIFPLALVFEREARPRLTFKKLSQFFLSGLIGICINQLLFLAGLYYTSATFAATVQNLTPALTFAMAALLRIESIRFTRREGQAKALGIAVCVGGAILIALYKGPSVVTVQSLHLYGLDNARLQMDTSAFVSWQLGAVCLLGNCVTWAIWFILQTPIIKDYPAQLSATAFTYMFGSLQLALVAVCLERDPDVWATSFSSDLPAILYGGLVASGLAMTLQGWCAHHGGPVLVAAYQPLQTVLVAILSSIFLQETFYLGSLLGGFLIVTGLYMVVWGKSRESRLEASSELYVREPTSFGLTTSDASLAEPLLHNTSEEP